MPTYDYRCKACEHEFEEFQSMTAAPLRTCPACGKKQLERLIGTGAGLIFKGSGFYETDYRSDSYKKAQEAESKQSADKSGDAKQAGGTDAANNKPSDEKQSAGKPKGEQKEASGGAEKSGGAAAPSKNGAGASSKKGGG